MRFLLLHFDVAAYLGQVVNVDTQGGVCCEEVYYYMYLFFSFLFVFFFFFSYFPFASDFLPAVVLAAMHGSLACSAIMAASWHVVIVAMMRLLSASVLHAA